MGSSLSRTVDIPRINDGGLIRVVLSHIRSLDEVYWFEYDFQDVHSALQHPSNFQSVSQTVGKRFLRYDSYIDFITDPMVEIRPDIRESLLLDEAAIRFEEQLYFVETNNLFPDFFKSAYKEVVKHIRTPFFQFQHLTASLTNNQVVATFSDDTIHLLLKSEQSSGIEVENQNEHIHIPISNSSAFTNSFKEMMQEQSTPIPTGYHVDHILSLYLILAIFTYISYLPQKQDQFDHSILEIVEHPMNIKSSTNATFFEITHLLDDTNINAQIVSPEDHSKFRDYDMALIMSLGITPDVIKRGYIKPKLTGKQQSLSLKGEAARRFLQQSNIVHNYFPMPFQNAFDRVFSHINAVNN